MRAVSALVISIAALSGIAGCTAPQVSPTQPVKCVYLPPGYELQYDKWSPYPVCPPLPPVVVAPAVTTPSGPGVPVTPTPSRPTPVAEQSTSRARGGADAVQEYRNGSWEGSYSGGDDGAGAYEGGTTITANARGLLS